jgi:hypothetical protein
MGNTNEHIQVPMKAHHVYNVLTEGEKFWNRGYTRTHLAARQALKEKLLAVLADDPGAEIYWGVPRILRTYSENSELKN